MGRMDTTTTANAASPRQTATNIRADLAAALPSVATTVTRRGNAFRVELRPTLDTTAERLRAHNAAVGVLRANGVTRDFVVAAVAA